MKYLDDTGAAYLASLVKKDVAGFSASNTTFNSDGTISEERGSESIVTTFNSDGTISEVLTRGENFITKTTAFSGNSISVSIS